MKERGLNRDRPDWDAGDVPDVGSGVRHQSPFESPTAIQMGYMDFLRRQWEELKRNSLPEIVIPVELVETASILLDHSPGPERFPPGQR